MFSSSNYLDTSNSKAATAEPADGSNSVNELRSGEPRRISFHKKNKRAQEREGSSHKKSYMLFDQENGEQEDGDDVDNCKQIRL